MLHEILDFFGRAICHQLEERSLFVSGEPLSVCARDTGIYIGIFSTLSYLYFSKRKTRLTIPSIKISFLLLLFLIPLILDGFGSYLHFFQSSNSRRLVTGILFGFVLPFFLYPLILLKSPDQINESVIRSKKDLFIPLFLSVSIGVVFYWGLLSYYILDSFIIVTLIVWISLCASFLFSYVKNKMVKWALSFLLCLLFLSGLSLLHEWVLKLS